MVMPIIKIELCHRIFFIKPIVKRKYMLEFVGDLLDRGCKGLKNSAISKGNSKKPPIFQKGKLFKHYL
jgi:hypothetical protein